MTASAGAMAVRASAGVTAVRSPERGVRSDAPTVILGAGFRRRGKSGIIRKEPLPLGRHFSGEVCSGQGD